MEICDGSTDSTVKVAKAIGWYDQLTRNAVNLELGLGFSGSFQRALWHHVSASFVKARDLAFDRTPSKTSKTCKWSPISRPQARGPPMLYHVHATRSRLS